MGESCITIAPRTDEEARIALSSLIHALHELDSYAVARIVLKENKDPQIILLAPYIEPDIEGLIDVPLPFAEDVRTYRFPPLDRVITKLWQCSHLAQKSTVRRSAKSHGVIMWIVWTCQK